MTLHTKLKFCLSAILLAIALSSLAFANLNEIITIGNFSNQKLEQWKEKSFQGNTEYSIQNANGKYYLQASSNKTASALYKRVKVDLTKTPFLNWSWSVSNPLPRLQEQSKQGDDYAARIYVVVKRGVMPWQTYALNYVWSSNASTSNAWPNAHVANAVMIPVRFSSDSTGQWITEKFNVRADLKKILRH